MLYPNHWYEIYNTFIFPTTAICEAITAKKNTLFDAVVAAIAKRLNADAIFSFDEWYRKIGLTLTDDLIQARKQAA